jgi:hypothetical protein
MGDMGGGSAAKSFPPPRQQVPCLFSLPGPKGVGAYDAYVQPSPLKQLYSLPPSKAAISATHSSWPCLGPCCASDVDKVVGHTGIAVTSCCFTPK